MDVASGSVWFEQRRAVEQRARRTAGGGVEEYAVTASVWTMRSILAEPEEYNIDGYSKSFMNWPADLNGDGKLDLIVVDFPGAPTWWFENPGTFSRSQRGALRAIPRPPNPVPGTATRSCPSPTTKAPSTSTWMATAAARLWPASRTPDGPGGPPGASRRALDADAPLAPRLTRHRPILPRPGNWRSERRRPEGRAGYERLVGTAR